MHKFINNEDEPEDENPEFGIQPNKRHPRRCVQYVPNFTIRKSDALTNTVDDVINNKLENVVESPLTKLKNLFSGIFESNEIFSLNGEELNGTEY